MKDADQQIIALLNQIKALSGGGSGAAWGAITGTLSAQTDLQAALDAKPGYKVYTALLTQSGTDAPLATVLQNTLGGTVVWTRADQGDYEGTLTGAFTVNKTAGHVAGVIKADSSKMCSGAVHYSSLNACGLKTFDFDNVTRADDLLNQSLVEIRIYP